MAKYIFITGGVVSGLGKGIAAASLGRLLKARGLKVALQKFDPYLNIDPGTMNPYQHGEVFVTEDGAETDLDLGHYERFTDEDLTVDSSITSGKVYWSVLSREREGAFLGGTVQVIPHITGEIKERIYRVGRREEADVVITEIGGTVGDIESQPLPPRLPRRLHSRHRGAQEQAHPAFCKGAAGPGHPAGCDPLPLRRAGVPEGAGQDRPVLQCAAGAGHLQRDRPHPLRSAADAGGGRVGKSGVRGIGTSLQ